MTKGWKNESARHALARKGIKTGQKTTPRANPNNTKTQKEINKLLFNPTKSQTDPELLEIIVRKDKAHHFDFLKGYTDWATEGRWGGLDENNTLIQVQFKDTPSEKVGKRLKQLLKKYNKAVVKEDVLYFRTLPVEETSL